MGVEHLQLLPAMGGIERVVEVEHDPARHLAEAGAVEIDHRPGHPQQGADVRPVLQPRDCRLRAQVGRRGQPAERHLEGRIAAQAAGVDRILVAAGDHKQAKADHVGQAVPDPAGLPVVRDAGRQPPGDAEPPLDLAQHQHAGIRRQAAAIESGFNGLAGNR